MVISIVLTLAGIISVFSLPIALYPEITPPEVVVSASYPGASAEVIAKTVGIPLEEEINGVEDMLYMSSSSENSSYQLTVTFKVGVDRDMAQVKVQNRIQQAQSKLPTDVTRQGLTVKSRSSNMLGMISIISPNNTYSQLELADYVQNNVKDSLSRVSGVGEVNVYSSRLSMRVWLDADKITALNIPISSIKSAIEGQNYQPSLGSIGAMPGDGTQQMVYTLQTQGRINEVEDFKNIIIRTAEQGGLVYLKDIARVEIGEEDYHATSKYNGAPNVAIAINQLAGANALDAMAGVKAEIERLSQRFPDDIIYTVGYDSTGYIKASIEEVIFTLVLTFALVIFVCYIFLQDWRSTLVPTLTIPVSIFATFAVMLALGYSLNMMTLFGLVLAIGLVVDDAIVVVDRVLFLMESEKLTPKEATIKAMEQVSSAIVATTLVLLAIFVPVGFLGGITGQIYKQFAIAISTSVAFSALNALTLSPALCATLLHPFKPAQSGPLFWFNRIINRSRDRYASVVGLLGRKVSVIFLLMLMLFAGVGGFLHISQTSFIPSEDQGVIFMNIQLPEGATRNRTQEFADKIYPLIKEEPGVENVMVVVGASMIGGSGENVALGIITLHPWNERKGDELYSTNILNRIRAKLIGMPEAEIQLFEPPAIMGLGMSGGMDYRLQALNSDDPQQLEAALKGFLAKLNQDPNISYAYTTYTAQTPNYYITIDREKAEAMKVSIGSIYDVLQNYLGSSYVNDVNFGTQVNKVMIQADWKYRKDLDSLKQLHVQNQNGEMVPLETVISLKKVLAPRVVTRYNQYPSASITAVQNQSSSTGQAMGAVENLSKSLPNGFSYDWSGMSYQEKSSSGQIGYLIVLAMTFAYLFLVAQYESWSTPLPVLTSVSVAMLGALAGLFITGLPLSIYAQLGLILLVGLAAKNAILIVEFAVIEMERGKTLMEATLSAARIRLRPILMTSFAFILGCVPLALASGSGAYSRNIIGIVVIAGMTMATVVGIFLIPCSFYFIMKLFRVRIARKTVETEDPDEIIARKHLFHEAHESLKG